MLTIDGTALPTTDIRVMFGHAECTGITASDTQITCTLASAPAAGNWDVEVTNMMGLTPIASGVAKISVSLVVTDISPSTGLNQLGGDELTITGEGFDPMTGGTSITFSDATPCEITSVSQTELKCISAGFDSGSIDTASPYTVNVDVNGETDSGLSIIIDGLVLPIASLSRTSVSPVLASILVLTLPSDYSGAMNSVDDFTAELIDSTDASITKPLYVMAVDGVAKTVTVKFPGADSGVYYV